MYRTSCDECGNREATFDWLEWSQKTKRPIRLKYECPNCGVRRKTADDEDHLLSKKIDQDFENTVVQRDLWYPKTTIPKGDKTDGLIRKGYTHFFQLFTKRNLLALALIQKELTHLSVRKEVQEFLQFAFSSSLKWASKQSHLRGETVEGWAMHAYWLYPKTLEINVWNTFSRRFTAIARGKKYTNSNIASFFQRAKTFEDIRAGNATCLILNQSSKTLSIPDETVDAVITDPPFGGNVNYGELADYWIVWKTPDSVIDKSEEVIINTNQRKTLDDYEEGLKRVFDQCFRVLKKNSDMVVTFNSTNLRVVASFVIATARAGFLLHPQGLVYQPPIRAYATTFHAMQIGAFTGDFIFTFYKPQQPSENTSTPKIETEKFKAQIEKLIENRVKDKITEPELREKAYRTLIPFLALHSRSSLSACREAVEYFETRMKKLRPHFKELRGKIVKERRKKFSIRKHMPVETS